MSALILPGWDSPEGALTGAGMQKPRVQAHRSRDARLPVSVPWLCGPDTAAGWREQRPGYCRVSRIPWNCATGIPGSDRSLGFAARPKGRARRKCAVWLLRPDRTRSWNSAVVSNDDQAAGKRPWPKEPTQAGGPGTDAAVDLDSQFQVRIWTQNIYGSRGRVSHR